MRIGITIALLFGMLALSGCTAVVGAGPVRSESRDVRGFSAIDLAGNGELVISQTGSESLTIESEENILPLLTSRVSNGTLMLGDRDNVLLRPTKPIRYRLTVKDLHALTLSGSGKITATPIATDDLRVNISGSGEVRLSGKADPQQIEISGSGRYDGTSLESKTATANITGSGAAIVNSSTSLTANIAGSGTIEYLGNPQVIEQVYGSGRIVRR